LSSTIAYDHETPVIDSARRHRGAGKNITVQWRDGSDPLGGCHGVLVVNGTLTIPAGSELINKAEVDLSGTIVNNGTFTNMIDGVNHTYESNFFGVGGTLPNNGIFVANAIWSSADRAGEGYDNDPRNPDLTLISALPTTADSYIRGSITSTPDFHKRRLHYRSSTPSMTICDRQRERDHGHQF
jgi:hypothetical protein